MSATDLYGARRIKPTRRRATQVEMEERARFLIDYAERHGPVTVRQLYYRAEITSLPGIDKTEAGYTKIQRQVLLLRRDKRLSYEHIADSTRWMRKPRTYDSVEQALRDTAATYRKALWRDAEVYIEVWIEKDALAGVILPVTALFDVPLMVARGFTSETFCFEAIESREGDDRHYIVYSLGDLDRSGRDAVASLKEKLERLAREKGVGVEFVHLAIEADDVYRFDASKNLALVYLHDLGHRWLPTREPKRNSAADKKWPYPFAIELDAIEPDDLRAMVRRAIEQDLSQQQLKVLRVAEESERELIKGFVASLEAGR